ncbi:MAG: hypothetical protein IGS03_08035 [Candidatus Sericytochromatia bacterium]|nr:hypothetical protein [Candidatus Sericytochromatia bacterium]
MTQVSAMPGNAWYHPGTYIPGYNNLTSAPESPQAPENPTLDKIQLTINALYAGKAASMSGVSSLIQRQNVDVRLANHGSSGVTAGTTMGAAIGTAKKTLLVAGGLSVLRNVSHLAQGDINLARASGNISADIATGTLGGLAAGAASGIVVNGSSNAGRLLAGGLGSVAGVIGYVAVDVLLDKTGFKGFISDKITSLLEGGQTAAY